MLIESLLASTRESDMTPLFIYIFFLFYFILFNIQGTSSSRLVFFIVFYATDGVRALYGG